MLERLDLADDGVTVLPAAVPTTVVAALQQELAAGFEADHPGRCVRPNSILVPLRWCDELIALLLGSPAFTAAVRSAGAADDLRWTSGYVSLRDAHTGPLAWHQDWWCWDHPVSFAEAPPQIALLVYLSDTDERSGALRSSVSLR